MAGRHRRHRWSARLAALAALLTLPAVAGVLHLASPDEPPDPSDALVRSLVSAGEPSPIIECVLRLDERDLRVGPLEPAAQRELVEGCHTARDALVSDVAWDPPAALADAVQPLGFGDDPRLDQLWLACEEGSGAACDRLFETAPVNSAYETFGLTCGDRPDVLDCAELDREDAEVGAGAP